ncbi:MAG: hypothetical protein F7B60_06470 [Desulfurococcales archaeon]|nr:hypothetical protein [Desulfurococcales archaeon]
MSYYSLLRKAVTQIKGDPEVSDETKTIILEKARVIYDLLGSIETLTMNIEEYCGKPQVVIDDKFTNTEEIYSLLSDLYDKILKCYRKLSYNTNLLKSLYIASFTAALSSIMLAVTVQGLSIYNISVYAIVLALIVSGLSLYKYRLGAYSILAGSIIEFLFEVFTLEQATNYVVFLAISILLIPLVTSFYIVKNKTMGLLIG